MKVLKPKGGPRQWIMEKPLFEQTEGLNPEELRNLAVKLARWSSQCLESAAALDAAGIKPKTWPGGPVDRN